MNIILPRKSELIPVTNSTNTFADCHLTCDFEFVTFQQKLQVMNDIIRQSVLVSSIPNPKNEVDTLTGDSITASLAMIEYMKEFRIGKNYRLALARKRSFDTENMFEMRFIVLVDDEDDTTYQVDCSMFVGYKCGKVELLKKPFYEHYDVIDSEILETLMFFRNAIYTSSMGTDYTPIEFFQIIDRMEAYEVLNDYYSFFDIKTCNFHNPNISDTEKNKQIQLLNSQIKIWTEELNDLVSSDTQYERQIELAQTITSERKRIMSVAEPNLEYDNRTIPYSQLTPRFFYENGLTLVMIKPSAYCLGVQSTISEKFLHHGNGAFGCYSYNMGNMSECGLYLMRMFHPHGYKYERSMYGPSKTFLVHEKAKNVLEKKRELRKTLGINMHHRNVKWFDGGIIEWNPIITNLVHSTDDPSETCLHYVSPYPEYQMMTRFMYPNLKMQF